MAGKVRVLVAEDNVVTRKLITDTLELEGYDVEAVGDGPRALEVLSGTELPKVVVLDVMMPGMDGFTVLQKIREDQRTAEIPVLMLTALSDNESTWKGWSAGCNYYLPKPFEVEDLISTVADLVGAGT